MGIGTSWGSLTITAVWGEGSMGTPEGVGILIWAPDEVGRGEEGWRGRIGDKG
jgi:hypothetical protein